MPTNKSVILNTFAQFGGKVGTVLASLIVVKIVSGYGAAFYGDYVTAYEFLAFFGVLADAGLFAIAVRDISRKAHAPDFVLGNILTMRLGLIALAVLAAGLMAQLIPSYSEAVKLGIWITGLSMALTIVAGSLSAILQARMKIHLFSGSLVTGKILLAGLVWLISLNLWAPVDGTALFLRLLWAGVISNLLFCALVWHWARREVPIKLQYHASYWHNTFKTSLPYGLALVLQTLYLRADLILISLILGSTAVGLYGVSARVLESFLVLGVFFGQALIPKLSQDEAGNSSTLWWGVEKAVFFALPIIIGGLTFAPEIITLLSNQTYLSTPERAGADLMLFVLLPTVLLAFMNQVFTFGLVSRKQQKRLLAINAAALGLNIGLNLYFLPLYGILAAAASTVLCELLVFALLLRQVLKHFVWQFNRSHWMIILGANLGLYLLLQLPYLREHFLTAVAVCGLYYASVLWYFRKQIIG